MAAWDMMLALSSHFSGFSLEKRVEWKNGPWRVRILPNKDTRQVYRIEVYAATPEEAIAQAQQMLDETRAAEASAFAAKYPNG